MRVLLDENLDHRLRKSLGTHEVFTASYKGWDGLKNGELLRTAEDNGIEVLITGDQSLCYEQNMAGRRLAICVVVLHRMAHHQELLAANRRRS